MDTKSYPIAIVQDRYNGAYSGGLWIAIARADENGRMSSVLDGGPHGGDTDAMMFWENPPSWVSVGKNPNDAVANLNEKLSNFDPTACPDCSAPDFADPETQSFVSVESGVQAGTHHGPAVHWAEGWIVCRKCGHTEWSGVSSD